MRVGSIGVGLGRSRRRPRGGGSINLLLEASANDRFFQNASGAPVFLFGDSAWSIITNATDAEQILYLDDRAARGVNCIIFQLLENQFGPTPPQDTDGNLPFTGTAFQSSLNEAYWVRVDAFIAAAAARGILCLLSVIYIGLTDAEGWGAEVLAASDAQMTAYGAAIGSRFVNFDNIAYCLYGDRRAHISRNGACVTGIKSTDARHTLYTSHFNRPNSSHDFGVDTWLTCNFLYPATGLAHVEADGAWVANIGPAFLAEDRYENATLGGGTPFYVRRGCWQAALSGALGGVIIGNEAIWAFGYNSLFPAYNSGYDWTANLGDPGITHAKVMVDLFNSIDYTSLVTEAQSATFVTAGRGTYASTAWVPCSRNAANTLAVAYIQGGGSITVNLALMAGPVTARWYDPTSGAFYACTGSPLANSGTHNFVASSERGNNAAGQTDWALILEA